MSRARHKMDKSCKASGGRLPMVAAGNPNVIKEAEEKKKGGAVKKHVGMEGAKSKHRMDRPKRASGGRVGSDKNPMSSAHKTTGPGPVD